MQLESVVMHLYVCQIKEDSNVLKENSEEYIVEFSITIRDPTYSELLSHPAASQYNDITKELRDKVSSNSCCKHPHPTVLLRNKTCPESVYSP